MNSETITRARRVLEYISEANNMYTQDCLPWGESIQQPISTMQCLLDSIAAWKTSIQKEAINLTTDIADNLPPLYGNPQIWCGERAIFGSLIRSAVCHTSSEGEINIRAESHGKSIQVSVQCTPYGYNKKAEWISEQMSELIYTQHGGSTTIEKYPGKSTINSLYLPLSTRLMVSGVVTDWLHEMAHKEKCSVEDIFRRSLHNDFHFRKLYMMQDVIRDLRGPIATMGGSFHLLLVLHTESHEFDAQSASTIDTINQSLDEMNNTLDNMIDQLRLEYAG